MAFARKALDECKLDKVFLLVEPRPRRKQGVRALEHRLAMVHLAAADDPKLGTIILEHERFTVSETLPLLLNRFNGAELHLLMGEDVARHLAEWPHAGDLSRDVRLIIGLRNTRPDSMQEQMEGLKKSKGLSFNYNILSTSLSNITSSKIRLSFKHGKASNGVHPKVAAYISTHRLYSAQD